MALFLLASLLDVVDGWLARRQGLVTFFGKFMDPLADKIMAMALLIYLSTEGRIDPWVVIVLLGREFYISGLRTLALSEGVEIVAGAGGKAKTAFQMIGISFVLLYFSYEAPFFGGIVDYHRLGLIFIYVSMVASIWSAVTYTIGFANELGRRT
jgi:CDP-diacylglycerol--glycerol-3-phosphate 3-phosphatidyltransferase